MPWYMLLVARFFLPYRLQVWSGLTKGPPRTLKWDLAAIEAVVASALE